MDGVGIEPTSLYGTRGENRTHDALIKSQVLYQLSYANKKQDTPDSEEVAPDNSSLATATIASKNKDFLVLQSSSLSLMSYGLFP